MDILRTVDYETELEIHAAFSEGYVKAEEKNKEMIEYIKNNNEYLLKVVKSLEYANDELETYIAVLENELNLEYNELEYNELEYNELEIEKHLQKLIS